MRILTVANHVGSAGGLERAQLEICSGLARRGHRLRLLYVSGGDFLDRWQALGAETIPISGSLPRRADPVRSVAGLVRAVGLGAAGRPDVVYVHRHWDVPLAVAVASATRARTFCHIHVPPPPRVPRWLPPALRRVSGFLSVSSDTARRWSGAGVDGSRVRIVPNAVDTARFPPVSASLRAGARRALGLPPEGVVVLYAGRIDPVKGVEVLIDACRELSRSGRPVSVAVAGGRSLGTAPAAAAAYEEALHSRSQGLEVRWLGHHPDPVTLYHAADVVAVPSLWPEPQPLVVLEALACGVPVVASRAGGIPEMLSGPLAQLLVEPGDASGLAERLWAVAREYRDRPERSAALREAVAARFPLEGWASRVEEVLEEGGREGSHGGPVGS